MTNEAKQPFEDDPFLDGANIDFSGYNRAKAIEAKDEAEGFWRMATDRQFRPLDVDAMLKDPDVQKELAKKDPAMRAALIEEEMGSIAEEFLRRTPNYTRTDKNYNAIVQHMAEKYLNKSWLPTETAENRLYDAGRWTVQSLTAAYKGLLQAGKLDLPKGSRRALTEPEKLELIAQIRLGDNESAVVNYITWALNDDSIEYQSPADILAKNPDLASEAACFIWYHSHAGEIDAATFNEFRKAKLAGHRMLTVPLIDKAHESWLASKKHSWLFDGPVEPRVHQPPTITTQDIEALDDDEIAKLYRASGHEYIKSLR